MVSRINIGDQDAGESLTEAAAAEQVILDEYYAD